MEVYLFSGNRVVGFFCCCSRNGELYGTVNAALVLVQLKCPTPCILALVLDIHTALISNIGLLISSCRLTLQRRLTEWRFFQVVFHRRLLVMCVFVPSRVRLLFAQCFYNAFPVYIVTLPKQYCYRYQIYFFGALIKMYANKTANNANKPTVSHQNYKEGEKTLSLDRQTGRGQRAGCCREMCLLIHMHSAQILN